MTFDNWRENDTNAKDFHQQRRQKVLISLNTRRIGTRKGPGIFSHNSAREQSYFQNVRAYNYCRVQLLHIGFQYINQ